MGMLAVLLVVGLGKNPADAEETVVDFQALDSSTSATLATGGVTVTGSNQIHVGPKGLGVIGGYYDWIVDLGESVTVDFDGGAAADVTALLSGRDLYLPSGDGDGNTVGYEFDLATFGVYGTSLGVVSISDYDLFDGSAGYLTPTGSPTSSDVVLDVSLAAGGAPISSFQLVVPDGFALRSLTYCPVDPGDETNRPPSADAGADRAVDCGIGGMAVVALDATGSLDPDGDELSFEWSLPAGSGASLDDLHVPTPSGSFPLGTTLVTLTVTDGRGGVDVDDVLVLVADTGSPSLVCTTDLVALWPPRHQLIPVEITVHASDACATTTELTVTCSVSSSEADDGKGDGRFVGDVDGLDGYTSPVPVTLTYDAGLEAFVGTVLLRAERDGGSTGRTYSIDCAVTDPAGNTESAGCAVVVPRDRSK